MYSNLLAGNSDLCSLKQTAFLELNQTMALSQLIPCLVSLILISLLVFPLAADTPMRRRKKSLDTIKSLNQNGPYLGLITTYPPEEAAFFATGAFRPHPIHPFVDLSGIYLHTNATLCGLQKFECTHKFTDTRSHPCHPSPHTLHRAVCMGPPVDASVCAGYCVNLHALPVLWQFIPYVVYFHDISKKEHNLCDLEEYMTV